MSKKIVYLEGRPNAHPLHRRLAQSLKCKTELIDPIIRWQDLEKSFLYKVFSWFVNAKFLASAYKDTDVFLVDNLHFTPVIMNMFFFRKKRKLIVHLGSHTLYFMAIKKFKPINLWLHKLALAKYDALICEGQMAKELAESIMKRKLPPTYTTFLGAPSERVKTLNDLQPSLQSPNILIIANGPIDFRLYYKGLDIMIKSFARANVELPELMLTILGFWSEEIIRRMYSSAGQASANIYFAGEVRNIEPYLLQSSLYLHCARGDAFPTSTIEAMTAGIPVVLSEFTGTKEIIEQIDPSLIVPLSETKIAERIVSYFKLANSQKMALSLKCREVAKTYTEETAIHHYQNTFNQILKELKLE